MPDIVARLDAAIAELNLLRSELIATAPVEEITLTDNEGAGDFAPANLVEISTAVERFNRPADALRFLRRKQNCGVKVGGRWMASAPRLARRLNGG